MTRRRCPCRPRKWRKDVGSGGVLGNTSGHVATWGPGPAPLRPNYQSTRGGRGGIASLGGSGVRAPYASLAAPANLHSLPSVPLVSGLQCPSCSSVWPSSALSARAAPPRPSTGFWSASGTADSADVGNTGQRSASRCVRGRWPLMAHKSRVSCFFGQGWGLPERLSKCAGCWVYAPAWVFRRGGVR